MMKNIEGCLAVAIEVALVTGALSACGVEAKNISAEELNALKDICSDNSKVPEYVPDSASIISIQDKGKIGICGFNGKQENGVITENLMWVYTEVDGVKTEILEPLVKLNSTEGYDGVGYLKDGKFVPLTTRNISDGRMWGYVNGEEILLDGESKDVWEKIVTEITGATVAKAAGLPEARITEIPPTFTPEPELPTDVPTVVFTATAEATATVTVTEITPDFLSEEKINFLATHEIKSGATDKNVVLMTYDDGGSEESIKSIMDVYNKYGYKTTFFVTGEWVKNHQELVKNMVDDGFEIGCHGWDHTVMTQLSGADANKQMVDFLTVMEQAVPGYRVKFIRFPFGARSDYLRLLAANNGMQSVMWDTESGGVTDRTVEYATRNLHPGQLVLSHSIRHFDVHQTEEIIKLFVSKGYNMATISEGMSQDDIYVK